jgi:hypothetical protein
MMNNSGLQVGMTVSSHHSKYHPFHALVMNYHYERQVCVDGLRAMGRVNILNLYRSSTWRCGIQLTHLGLVQQQLGSSPQLIILNDANRLNHLYDLLIHGPKQQST